MQKLLAILCLIGLTACGFQPIYGESSRQENDRIARYFAATDIRTKSGARGQQLKNALEDQLNPNSIISDIKKHYTLQVEVQVRRDATVIERDGSISRYNVNVSSNYRLRDANGRTLKKGVVRRTASYNDVNEHFSSYIGEKDAIQRAIKEMSEDYKMQLAAFYAEQIDFSRE